MNDWVDTYMNYSMGTHFSQFKRDEASRYGKLPQQCPISDQFRIYGNRVEYFYPFLVALFVS